MMTREVLGNTDLECSRAAVIQDNRAITSIHIDTDI